MDNNEVEKEKITRLSLDIPETLWRDLKIYCLQHDCKMAKLVRQLIVETIHEKDSQKSVLTPEPEALEEEATAEEVPQLPEVKAAEQKPVDQPVVPPFGPCLPKDNLPEYLRKTVRWMREAGLPEVFMSDDTLFTNRMTWKIRDALSALRRSESVICTLNSNGLILKLLPKKTGE